MAVAARERAGCGQTQDSSLISCEHNVKTMTNATTTTGAGMKTTRSNIKTQLAVSIALSLAAGLASTTALADGRHECSLKTLRGEYRFHADGYTIVNGVAQPKAIIETLVFDGEGNVTTPAVSVSLNGSIMQPPQGAPGTYTVDADCTGTITFVTGQSFDLQIYPSGNHMNLLQTNPNSVMQGTAARVSR